MKLTRTEIAQKIHLRLEAESAALAREWSASAPFNHFVLDDPLPVEWTNELRKASAKILISTTSGKRTGSPDPSKGCGKC